MGHQHQHCQSPHQDNRECKRRRASDSDATTPSQLTDEQRGDSQPSTPSSPSSLTTSPPLSASDGKSGLSSASAANGNSCHQCKTAKDATLLLFCTSAAEKGVRKRRCRKKYCDACLRRSYNPEVAYPCEQWVCPSCQGFCVCAACSRGVDGCEREGLTGAMAALSQMNPLILALLGVDERKLAQLQAVINTPQLMSVGDPGQAGLLASMIASANTYSVPPQPYINPAMLAALGQPAMAGVNSVGLGMQELNLNQHYEQAAVMSQPVSLLSMPPGPVNGYQGVDDGQIRLPVQSYMEQVAPLQPPHSNVSTASTVTSPYGTSSAYSCSSGTNSSSSSPLLRSAMGGQSATASLLSMPPLAPLPTSVTGTPNNSPRMVSRSHTQPQAPVEPIDHSPMQRQRLFSHPPLPPMSSSTPSMSRILPQPSEHSPHLVHDLSPSHAYSTQVYPQPLSRKRSYSNTMADNDAADVTRHRLRAAASRRAAGAGGLCERARTAGGRAECEGRGGAVRQPVVAPATVAAATVRPVVRVAGARHGHAKASGGGGVEAGGAVQPADRPRPARGGVDAALRPLSAPVDRLPTVACCVLSRSSCHCRLVLSFLTRCRPPSPLASYGPLLPVSSTAAVCVCCELCRLSGVAVATAYATLVYDHSDRRRTPAAVLDTVSWSTIDCTYLLPCFVLVCAAAGCLLAALSMLVVLFWCVECTGCGV